MKQAFLCVSFGTSVPAARKNIIAVEEALKAEVSNMDFYRAFTSPTIRCHLAARGETVWDVPEALDRLAEKGYKKVLIQPTHFLYGLEYEALCAKIEEKRTLFSSLLLGKPLLAHTEDLRVLSRILSDEYPQKPGESLLLMGHGTPHFSNVVYPALQAVFHMLGRRDVFVGTVEGWPDLTAILPQLREGGFRSVCLVPLMLVAGDHALHDMAGDEPDSWKQILLRDNFEVTCVMRGLGQLKGVQELYCQHVRAIED